VIVDDWIGLMRKLGLWDISDDVCVGMGWFLVDFREWKSGAVEC
jgi:hypothetical protein